ncbi:hypothetical protein [Moorena sp. SIO3A2]|uniref:hypothetical protein n=1 Tax=Moorena sp. SIO3A2 TaxID=2607841 RepID=UPI0013B99597|nr:hypothetical protein [Moorena sp. SIO3A2]NER91560.1 hypothetical protein [Moorena sp. SIO3A2]
MINCCITGPRTVKPEHIRIIQNKLSSVSPDTWHIGDAPGVDTIALHFLEKKDRVTTYHVTGEERWHFAERSTRMIKNCMKNPGEYKLLAFPNKPCPEGVQPKPTFYGSGSGTWGTIALCKYYGFDIDITFLEKNPLPEWLSKPTYEQLSLF